MPNDLIMPAVQADVMHSPSVTFTYRGREVDYVLTQELAHAGTPDAFWVSFFEFCVDGEFVDPDDLLSKEQCDVLCGQAFDATHQREGLLYSDEFMDVVRVLLDRFIDKQ
jgi:hypothetical protein